MPRNSSTPSCRTLIVVAIIAFILNRLLRLITARMIRVAEQHAAGRVRVCAGEDAGRRHSHHRRWRSSPPSSDCSFSTPWESIWLRCWPRPGVAGVAIGLAAQNIVNDMLNGVLILIEDQFNVGDTVRVAGLAGPWRR